MMTKMQKIVLLMTFWFSDHGAAKMQSWEFFTNDREYSEKALLDIIGFIVNGVDDKRVDWSALDWFVDAMNKETGLDVNKVPSSVAGASEGLV